MAALAEDFDVVRHTGTWPWPPDPAVTLARCAEEACHDAARYVARADGTLIGMVLVKAGGEFGYMLAARHWGQGYATEMGRAAIDHFFATGPWPRLKAVVFEDNPASVRVLAKLGFVEGPAGEGQCIARGGVFPTRTFVMERPQG